MKVIQTGLMDEDKIEWMNARKYMYQLLIVMFSAPMSQESYSLIKDNVQTNGFPEEISDGDFLKSFFQEEETSAIQKTREDYFRLFVGPESLPCPPWESVYRGKDRALFDYPTFEVRDLYSYFGLEMKKQEGQHDEADDHLIYELEFMSILIDQALEADSPAEQTAALLGQKKMLDEHLKKWIPDFAQDILTNASSLFFQGSANILNSFIQFDSELINELF